jgi:hypothetical protein
VSYIVLHIKTLSLTVLAQSYRRYALFFSGKEAVPALFVGENSFE